MDKELKSLPMKYDRKRGHWYNTCARGVCFQRSLQPPHLTKKQMLQLCEILQIPDEFSKYALEVTIEITSCKVRNWKDSEGGGSAQYQRCYKHRGKEHGQ